ncbi:MAG: O-antigen ligase family protein [Candidatus Portnoybacteria bacterium]
MLKKVVRLGIYLIVFSLPLYLIRFKIGWVPFNLSEILIYIVFILWLISRPKLREIFKEKKLFYPVLTLFLGLTISTLFSADLFVSAGIWKGWFLAPLLLFLVVISILENRRQVRNIIISLALSGLVVALISLYYWFSGNLTYDGRLRGFYLSANFLAMYLSPILILSLYLYSLAKSRIQKLSLAIGYWLMAATIYLTCSYGAFLGLLAACIFLSFSRRKIIFLLLPVLFVFILLFPTDKFQGFLDFSYPSIESRLVIWKSAWEILKDHPLVGVGPGMFQKYYLDYQPRFDPYPEWAAPQPHNLFLALWLQTGLIGLIGFIWLLVVFFKKNKPNLLGLTLAATMICILVHGLIDTTYWKNDLAVVFWLITALMNKAYHLPD